MLLQQTSEAWGQDDQSWLGSAHGTDATRSITLDTSAFDPATHYPKGYFLSGLAVALIGNTGKYGPASGTATDYGFIYAAVKAPVDNTIDVPCAMLDHGRVVTSKLPIAVTGQALSNPHFVFQTA
jgi:hypothetical protein